jgi:tetratricopeptide (TPR) repeat protein
MESATPPAEEDVPPDPMALRQEGDRLFERGRFTEASKLYELAFQAQPSEARTLQRLVDACIRSGSLDQARVHLDSLRLHFPDDLDLPLYEGDLALAHGDFHAAVSSFRRLLSQAADGSSRKARVRQSVLTALEGEWQSRLTDSASYASALYAALQSVFPFSAYRAKFKDLSALTDRELLQHFVNRFLVPGQSESISVSCAAPQAVLHESLAGEMAEHELDERITALLAEFPCNYLVEICPELEPLCSSMFAEGSGVGAASSRSRINVWQLLAFCIRRSRRLSDDFLRTRAELELAQKEIAVIRSFLRDQALETDTSVL